MAATQQQGHWGSTVILYTPHSWHRCSEMRSVTAIATAFVNIPLHTAIVYSSL